MLLHTSLAAQQGYDTIVIKSPDTDTAVLACAFCNKIWANIIFQTGTRNRSHLVAIGKNLGDSTCEALFAWTSRIYQL
jgi:hypothetical protein